MIRLKRGQWRFAGLPQEYTEDLIELIPPTQDDVNELKHGQEVLVKGTINQIGAGFKSLDYGIYLSSANIATILKDTQKRDPAMGVIRDELKTIIRKIRRQEYFTNDEAANDIISVILLEFEKEGDGFGEYDGFSLSEVREILEETK